MSALKGWKTPAKKTPEEKEAAREAAKAALKAAKKAAETKTKDALDAPVAVTATKDGTPGWKAPEKVEKSEEEKAALKVAVTRAKTKEELEVLMKALDEGKLPEGFTL